MFYLRKTFFYLRFSSLKADGAFVVWEKKPTMIHIFCFRSGNSAEITARLEANSQQVASVKNNFIQLRRERCLNISASWSREEIGSDVATGETEASSLSYVYTIRRRV